MPHCNKQMISFFLTTKCNLRCVYCYNGEERLLVKDKTLRIHIAKAAIDEYFSNNTSRHIRFYGPGEVTQEFDLMCQIVEYAKKVGGTGVTVEIQTNGVFSDNVCKWILDNINIMWVSFDGTPDIHDIQRPTAKGKPSSSIIEKNIKWLNSTPKKKTLMIGARVTMTELNIRRQSELVNYFNNLGIKYIWTDPLFPEVKETAVCNDKTGRIVDFFDMDTYIDNYINAYKYASDIGLFYGSFLTCNFDGKTNIHCRACTPVPHITPDGYVSACDMVVIGENAHHMDCFIYGKWDNYSKMFIYFDNKIKALKERTSDNISHCKTCEVKNYCGGYCLGEVVNETGKLDGQKHEVCKAIKRLFKEIGPAKHPYAYLHP
ncbi:radical SAM protein [Prolixibacteraceae bacterium JC049]|nr:radical SAM protein [Prolixibacteraceae bacterium JC049]